MLSSIVFEVNNFTFDDKIIIIYASGVSNCVTVNDVCVNVIII